MSYDIVKEPRRMIVGIPHKGVNNYEAISKLWSELYQRLGEIDDISEEGVFYGLCEAVDAKDNHLNYLAGVAVSRLNHVPAGMQAWYVSHEEYLVYPHRGHAKEIGESFEKIYHEILPEMGLFASDEYDFECYGPDFYEQDPPLVNLYVPVLREAPVVNGEAWRKARKLLLNEETAILHEEEKSDD